MIPEKSVGICGASLLFASVLTAGAEAEAPPVDLVWSDPYGLLPPDGREHLREELARFSAATDIAVRVVFPGEHARSRHPATPRVHVTLRPGGARHWGLEDQAMAAAVGERGASYSIFVFVDAVRRTLGHASDRVSPRELSELTRALARVVEHELVHVLAPERGHALSGLMSRELSRKLLLRKNLELDLTSLLRARDGAIRIGALQSPSRGAGAASLPDSLAPPPSTL